MARKKTAEKIEMRIDAYIPALLDLLAAGKQVLNIPKGKKVFSQSEVANAIFFIRSGKVKISTSSDQGGLGTKRDWPCSHASTMQASQLQKSEDRDSLDDVVVWKRQKTKAKKLKVHLPFG